MATIANKKHSVGFAFAANVFPNMVGIFSMRANEFRLGGNWDPIKNEIEIFRMSPDGQLSAQANVQIQILLKDPELSHPVDFVFAARQFTQAAERFLEGAKIAYLENRGG